MMWRRWGRGAAWVIFVASLVWSGSGNQLAWAGTVPQPGRPQAAESPALVYSSAPALADAGLNSLIAKAVGGAAGRWEVVVKKLDTGQRAAYGSGTTIISASLYKLFVLYEVFRQWDAGDLS